MVDQNDAFMRNQNAAVQARTKTQNRANVLQLKMIGQSHPTGLKPNLMKLFEDRPPLEFKPPPEKRKCPSYTVICPPLLRQSKTRAAAGRDSSGSFNLVCHRSSADKGRQN